MRFRVGVRSVRLLINFGFDAILVTSIRRPKIRTEIMNLSFSGCGFMGIYHVGVASAIKEYAPHLVAGKVTGASAGALAACGLICNICLGKKLIRFLK